MNDFLQFNKTANCSDIFLLDYLHILRNCEIYLLCDLPYVAHIKVHGPIEMDQMEMYMYAPKQMKQRFL